MPDTSLPFNVARLRPPVEEDGADGQWSLPLAAGHDPGGPRSSPDAEKEARRAEKRLRELEEPVEPWDRYRALRQTLDEAQKFEDLSDHKARFAMILMGALNALVLFAALPAVPRGLASTTPPAVAAYIALCGLVAVYLFHQAIEALRPRALYREEPAPIGLRHHDDVLRRSDEAYLEAWREVRVEQLNDEIARQVRGQAEVNKAKERALTRLYAGLRVMMFLLVGLVVFLVVTPKDGSRADGFYNLHPGQGPRMGVVRTIPGP